MACVRLNPVSTLIAIYRSLDYIYRRTGPISIEIVGKVAEAVLKGLMYLYDVHRIIHRGGYRNVSAKSLRIADNSRFSLANNLPLYPSCHVAADGPSCYRYQTI